MRLQPRTSDEPEAVSVSLHVCSVTLGPIKTLLTIFYHGARLEGHARFVSTEKSLGLRTTIGYRRIYVQPFAADAASPLMLRSWNRGFTRLAFETIGALRIVEEQSCVVA